MKSEYKSFVVILILIISFISLIVGSLNSNVNNAKVENEKASKLKGAFTSSSAKIALIKLNGIIDSSDSQAGFLSEDLSASNLLKSLKLAREDRSVKAVIVEINSPGGTVAASQNIYNEIMRIRKIKPVVVVMDDVAASGGYYIASAADRIIAQEGTLTGSIGVIMQTMDAHKLLTEKLGVKSNVIKSGLYKDAGSATREMTSDERQLFQDIVNDSYKQFVLAIEQGRVNRDDKYMTKKQELSKMNLEKYADGRVFTGHQAHEFGFIDAVGDIELAKDFASKMASEKFKKDFSNLPVNVYSAPSSFSQKFFGITENIFKGNTLNQYLPNSMNMSKIPLYLWE